MVHKAQLTHLSRTHTDQIRVNGDQQQLQEEVRLSDRELLSVHQPEVELLEEVARL